MKKPRAHFTKAFNEHVNWLQHRNSPADVISTRNAEKFLDI